METLLTHAATAAPGIALAAAIVVAIAGLLSLIVWFIGCIVLVRVMDKSKFRFIRFGWKKFYLECNEDKPHEKKPE